MIRDYRHIVTLQKRVETNDGQGGCSIVWKDAIRDYADVREMQGSENARFRRLSADHGAAVTIRWRNDVTTDMRLVHDGRFFDVVSVVDPDGRRSILQVYCFASSGG